MAIFSLNHSTIGRSTHAPRSASFYARYVTRPDACTKVLGERMPVEREELFAWLDAQEAGDRRNARVIDKVVVALPLELDPDERAALVHDFAERMTEGRASWVAGIHDGPGDADNPHAHIIFRDRDEEGARVMMLSDKGSTKRLREALEQETNIALERAGHDERVDHRSLEEQGIEREAQIHVGAAAKQLTERGLPIESQERQIGRLIGGERTTVTVNYPVIDQGKTRFEENEERKARNAERELEGQAAAMEGVIRLAHRTADLYQQFATLSTLPGDDADPMAFLVREHMGETRAPEPRGRPQRDEFSFGFEAPERAPRRDATDAISGTGLALIGRIADSLESLFDGSRPQQPDREDDPMGEQKQGQQQQHTAEQVRVEQLQRQREAEQAAWRQAELQAYLQQRDRERHHNRGR